MHNQNLGAVLEVPERSSDNNDERLEKLREAVDAKTPILTMKSEK